MHPSFKVTTKVLDYETQTKVVGDVPYTNGCGHYWGKPEWAHASRTVLHMHECEWVWVRPSATYRNLNVWSTTQMHTSQNTAHYFNEMILIGNIKHKPHTEVEVAGA